MKEKIFWVALSVHNWVERQTEHYKKFDTDEVIYERDTETFSFDDIDRQLSARKTADDKLSYLLELSKNQSKNRFAI